MTIFATKNIPSQQSQKRMTFIDGLRAIAALMVILPHSGGIWKYNSISDFASTFFSAISGIGRHCGVPIFFVVSGFAIAYSTRQVQITPTWFRYFFLKRLIRLNPPYYFSILVMILWSLLQIHLGRGALGNGASNQLPSLFQFLAHLLYLQSFFDYANINPVYWSLSIEIQLYIVFGLLMIVLHFISRRWFSGKSNVITWLFIFIALFSLTRPFTLKNVGGENAILFFPFWFMFSAGVIVWWGIEGTIHRYVGWFFITMIWIFAVVTGELEVIAATATATLIYLCGFLNKLHIWLDLKPLQLVGLASYSLYVIHTPVINLVMAIQTRTSRGGDFENLIFLLACISISIVAAITMYYLVEVPSIKWGKKLTVPISIENNKDPS